MWTGNKMRAAVERLKDKEFTKKVLGKHSVRNGVSMTLDLQRL
jgi:hypothetical protein